MNPVTSIKPTSPWWDLRWVYAVVTLGLLFVVVAQVFGALHGLHPAFSIILGAALLFVGVTGAVRYFRFIKFRPMDAGLLPELRKFCVYVFIVASVVVLPTGLSWLVCSCGLAIMAYYTARSFLYYRAYGNSRLCLHGSGVVRPGEVVSGVIEFPGQTDFDGPIELNLECVRLVYEWAADPSSDSNRPQKKWRLKHREKLLSETHSVTASFDAQAKVTRLPLEYAIGSALPPTERIYSKSDREIWEARWQLRAKGRGRSDLWLLALYKLTVSPKAG